jgi:hypothetical protein
MSKVGPSYHSLLTMLVSHQILTEDRLLTSALVDIYVGTESTHWPLHERLLCYHSPFFANIFYKDDNDQTRKYKGSKSYGLPDEDEYTFELLVGWLYSKAIRHPQQEKELGPIFDLYLLSEKLQMEKLSSDIVEVVRDFYNETDEDNEMREMLVSSIARQLTTADMIPAHWAKALQRNGQLAVDIIRAIQQWHLEERSIPDMRDGSIGRGRADLGGFSAIEREGGESMETDNTDGLGVESVNSGLEKVNVKSDEE